MSVNELMPDPEQRHEALMRLLRRVRSGTGHKNGGKRGGDRVALVDRINEYKQPSVTAQERRVLVGLCGGLQTQEVADVLGVTLESVKCSIKQAMRKLRAKTRGQLCANAVREGIVK